MDNRSPAKPAGLELEARIVRYAELAPCRDAFIDTRSPGSDQKENFTIIGPGVAENPNQFVHITEPHGFNIGGARQPPQCLNSQHSHDTVEVFYVHSGIWRFMTGETGEDGEVRIGAGDLISIPTKLLRGFENVGSDTGFLWAVLGGDDPGHVLWAPHVFDMAKDFGLVLLENGILVDTAKGETVPPDARRMPATTPQQVAAMRRADSAELERCVLRAGESRPGGMFPSLEGVKERLLVGAPPLDWTHGFSVIETTIEAGAELPDHAFSVPDVWFVQHGEVEVRMEGQTSACGAGDNITLASNTWRGLRNRGDRAAVVVQVRGGDTLPKLRLRSL